MKYIDEVKVTKNDDATVTLEGEIPFSELEQYEAKSLEELGKNVEVDGFRKGHIPEDVIREKVGETALLSEMAERALAKAYPHILEKHEVDAIGYPQVSITKLAKDNPLGFKIQVAIMPTITLPDYMEIAKGANSSDANSDVSDEEVENATKDILRRKVAYERLQQKAAQKEEGEESNSTDLPTPETVEQTNEDGEVQDNELPELTDEVAKTLGDFANVTEFKDKLRSELEEQKALEAKNKQRAAITDAILEKTEMTVPEVMVEAELEQFLAQMQEDLTRAQLSMEDYLSHIKKTKEELKSEWRPAAEKRAKTQLVLDKIAEEEKIEPDQKLVDEQVQSLKEQYQDADEERIRIYVTSVLKNEAVMNKLEGKADNTAEAK